MKYSEKLDLSGKFTKFSRRKWEYLVVPRNKQLDNPSVTAYAVPPPFTQGRLGRMEVDGERVTRIVCIFIPDGNEY